MAQTFPIQPSPTFTLQLLPQPAMSVGQYNTNGMLNLSGAGLLDPNASMQLPTPPAAKFDPRGAIVGGALMDLGNLILDKPMQNMTMQLLQRGEAKHQAEQQRAIAAQDRQLQSQLVLSQIAKNLQVDETDLATNMKALGLDPTNLDDVATYQQAMKAPTSNTPATIETMKAMGYDPTNPDDQAAFYAVRNKGTGTNITLNQPGETSDRLATLATDRYIQAIEGLEDTERTRALQQMALLNPQLTDAGVTGELKDNLQKISDSFGLGINVSDETGVRALFRAIQDDMALEDLQQFKGPTTDFEFNVTRGLQPNLDATREGRALLIQKGLADEKRNRMTREAYTRWYDAKEAAGEPAKYSDWIRSDEYKALSSKSAYEFNPKLAGALFNAMRRPEDRKALAAVRLEQLTEQYPDMSAVELGQIMVNEGFNLEAIK